MAAPNTALFGPSGPVLSRAGDVCGSASLDLGWLWSMHDDYFAGNSFTARHTLLGSGYPSLSYLTQRESPSVASQ